MKLHAILIQAHAYPELTKLIIERLASENHYFFIHVDAKTKDYESFTSLESDHVIFTNKRYKVNWGAAEQIYLTIDLIKKAYSFNNNFDYYHLISGQDYPHFNAERFDSFFESTSNSYMELDTNNINFDERFMYYHTNSLLSTRTKWGRRLESYCIKLQKLLCGKSYPRKKLSMKVFKGSNWWSLHRNAITYLIDFLEKEPLYLKRFSYTKCCDEIFFHTILFNSKLHNTIYLDDLRYTDWNKRFPEEKLPRILTVEDYQAISSTHTIFIRKVDLNLSKPLLDLLK